MKKVNRGFSLIEVLVSLVIFAIGILGLMGLYVSSLKAQADAKARSAITIYTASMMDRIAANASTALDKGSYNLAFGAAAPSPVDCQNFSNGKNYADLMPGKFSPLDLAKKEVEVFRKEVGCNLPEGDASIVAGSVQAVGAKPCDAPTVKDANMITMQIRWQDTRSSNSQVGGNAQFECYNLSMRIR